MASRGSSKVSPCQCSTVAEPGSRGTPSRNRRRYQDVLALLDAGVDVIGAFNIQHLESLNDVVLRVRA